MPPSDYKGLVDHGHHAAAAAPVILYGLRARLTLWWNRIFKRDGVEGHKFESYK